MIKTQEIMQTSTPLTATQMKAWTKHVLKEFPKEACAYIVDGRIFPVENIHPEPNEHFSVSKMDRFAASNGKITGFLHSHGGTPRQIAGKVWPIEWPSSADMSGWMKQNFLPDGTQTGHERWGISATEGENVTEPIWFDEDYVAELEGRPFIGGIWDCYTAIRDWYRVKLGITLKNYPRGIDKWTDDFDLYEDNFRDCGFEEVDPRDVKPNDVVLYRLNSPQIIHGGIYLGDGRIFHQLNSENLTGLSGFADEGRWARHVAKYVRYKGEQE